MRTLKVFNPANTTQLVAEYPATLPADLATMCAQAKIAQEK